MSRMSDRNWLRIIMVCGILGVIGVILGAVLLVLMQHDVVEIVTSQEPIGKPRPKGDLVVVSRGDEDSWGNVFVIFQVMTPAAEAWLVKAGPEFGGLFAEEPGIYHLLIHPAAWDIDNVLTYLLQMDTGE